MSLLFCKQKTAYEMRISDWSSDVCSSDLGATGDNMTDWYYHDPAQGRVGPLSAEQVRTRYVDRRIQRDTLAWHAGVREWQPLDRFSDELQLDTAAPDASQPPPLPPATPPPRSEEQTSELQSPIRTSYAVF